MQVDLFSSSKVTKESQRLSAQIESRKFAVAKLKWEKFPEQLSGFSQEQTKNYKKYLESVMKQKRVYERIGRASCDNLWELEVLGLGEYTKAWMLYLDFSDALDFVMEKAFDCDRAMIREIPNYSDISKRLMSYNVADATERLNVLFQNEEVVHKVYVPILNEVGSSISMNTSSDDKVTALLYKFYTKLLETTAAVRDYVIADIQMNNRGSVVYRSKNYCAGICTSDADLTCEVTLHVKDREDYSVPLYAYKTFEWTREVVTDETRRDIFSW